MELVKSGNTFPHFLAMSNELSTPRVLFCPQDERHRTRATTFAPSARFGAPNEVVFNSDTNLTYFVGVEASDQDPHRLLMGDDNFTISGLPVPHRLISAWTNTALTWTAKRHEGHGNICLVDGSVRRLTNLEFRKALADAGGVARLSMP